MHQNRIEGQCHSSVFDLLFRGQRSLINDVNDLMLEEMQLICMEGRGQIFTFDLIFGS